jgi:hypothetical protein
MVSVSILFYIVDANTDVILIEIALGPKVYDSKNLYNFKTIIDFRQLQTPFVYD